MTYQIILIFTVIATTLAGCPKLHRHRPSHKICERNSEGIETCSFSCPDWADLIGSQEVKCSPESGKWSHPAPICAPNFLQCGRGKKTKARCPAIKKSDLLKVKELDIRLTRQERKIVRELTKVYKSMKAMRGPIMITRKMCSKSLCRLNCYRVPNYALAKICRTCMKADYVKCKSSGSFFG